MIKEILYKWFRVEPFPCQSCEILREQLANSERERRELLNRLLVPPESKPTETSIEEFKPVGPQFVPWRIRQQMLEAEDRVKAAVIRRHREDVEQLEKELGVSHASEKRETVQIHADDGAQSVEETG